MNQEFLLTFPHKVHHRLLLFIGLYNNDMRLRVASSTVRCRIIPVQFLWIYTVVAST